MTDLFKCEVCFRTFEKIRRDSEALKELGASPWIIEGEKVCAVCDDCFVEFKKWFGSLPTEEQERLRAEGTSV